MSSPHAVIDEKICDAVMALNKTDLLHFAAQIWTADEQSGLRGIQRSLSTLRDYLDANEEYDDVLDILCALGPMWWMIGLAEVERLP